MKNLYNELTRNLKELNELSTKLQRSIKSSENGAMYLKNVNGENRFYCYKENENHSFEYLGKNQKEKISNLAQKGYETKLLKIVQKQEKAAQKCLSILSKAGSQEDFESVYEKLPSELKNIVKPINSTDDAYATKWLSYKYTKKPFPNDCPFFTMRGDQVRSKSELIIADRLYMAGIPYHYEAPTSTSLTDIFYPDFTVLNKRTRKEYLWEHFGMMDNPQYCAACISRLHQYAQGDYYQGENLIITYECATKPLETKYVDWLIEKYLK